MNHIRSRVMKGVVFRCRAGLVCAVQVLAEAGGSDDGGPGPLLLLYGGSHGGLVVWTEQRRRGWMRKMLFVLSILLRQSEEW